MTVRVRGYHLPEIERSSVEFRSFDGVEVELARVRPAQLRRALEQTRSAAAALRARHVEDILQTLDQVITRWLEPNSPWRQLAETVLVPTTGFSLPTIRHGLPLLIGSLQAPAIRNLLNDELGDYRILEHVGAGRHACGPGLITHVLSGNIPGLAAVPAALSLALKSAVLMKPATGDLVFPALFAAAIAEVDPELGRCLLVAGWRGGDEAVEAVAFGDADLVVASGSDAAIAAIRARARGRFIGHGHKISFAVIGKGALRNLGAAEELAHRLAYDVSLWDQQGCLSPQLCYIEAGGRITAAEFAQLLSQALAAYSRELPPRRLSFEERAAVLRFRQDVEWRGTDTLITSDDSSWSVAVERDTRFAPSCLNRCIRLKVLDDLAALPGLLQSHRPHLEAAGLACAPERFAPLTQMLSACGVHHVCAIGAMQRPPLSWRQSGRPRVADWVEWEEQKESEVRSQESGALPSGS